MYRRVRSDDLVGKTIKEIDSAATNVLKIAFTDGSSIELWAENDIHTDYGSIPGIFIDDPSVAPKLQDDRVL